jgi:hypothetical protein
MFSIQDISFVLKDQQDITLLFPTRAIQRQEGSARPRRLQYQLRTSKTNLAMEKLFILLKFSRRYLREY